ncbi:MAG: HAD family hydrolase [Candidatus Omnitrophica bacterium]|nr:HAD family hydrolase [Candidatus Omnitrophota bacterium]
MNLAIFDFDGTISTKDSFEDFIFFSHGRVKTVLGILKNAPTLLQYLFGSMSNSYAKEKIFTYFYQGWEITKFDQFAQRHALERLPKILRPQALEKLAWHKAQGHKIVIVSASFENYLGVWCKREGFELLATQLQVIDDKITGKFASNNCFGEEKINRLKQAYNLADFEFIYAYGDSRGDLPLKTIANEFHYKPFRD